MLLLTTLVLMPAGHTSVAGGVIRSDAQLTEDQLGVYSSFLETLSGLHVKNLANRTIRLDLSDLKDDSACLQGIELENSVEARKTTHPFGPEFAKGQELTLVDPFQQLKVIEQEEKHIEVEENAAEPKSAGAKSVPQSSFLLVSEIAFDKTHQYALLKYVLLISA